MAQANVYTSVSSQTWYTDKALISTGNTSVTYNVYIAALTATLANGASITTQTAVGNLYSNAVIIPAYDSQYVYVGVGNQLTITGSNFTAAESGTATSAAAGENGQGSY
jgi:hypothetical protein